MSLDLASLPFLPTIRPQLLEPANISKANKRQFDSVYFEEGLGFFAFLTDDSTPIIRASKY